MFKLQHKLKTFLLCLAALFCIGLGAQDLKVAVLEPVGNREVNKHFSLIRNAFISSITKTRGFQIIDRARTDQILQEHNFQRASGLLASSEARELGKMLGVDFIFTSEVIKHDDDLEVNCQALDIVTGQVVGSENTLLENVTARVISQSCQDLMETLLKTVNRRVTTTPNRGQSSSVAGGGSSDTGSSNSMLSGLDDEIRRLIMNNRSNAKWNRNRANYTLEVNLGGVSLNENRQFGTSVYRVTGTIAIMLADEENEKYSDTELEIEAFTEMTRDLIRNKIRSQVQSKTTRIIKELLDGLGY